MDNQIKCYIINKDISIFYELDKMYHVNIVGESKKYYDIIQFNTLDEAKAYVNKITHKN